MSRSIKCQDDSFKSKNKTLENNKPVSEGIYSDLECKECSEQKQLASLDELTTENVRKLTPHIPMEPQDLASCLDLKSTLENDDNIFNCIFGRLDMYGTYVCSDGGKYREDLSDSFKSTEFLEQYHDELIPILHRFITGATDMKNFPQAFKVKSEIQKFNEKKEEDLKELKEELEKVENEETFRALYHLDADKTTANEEKKLLREEILENCDLNLKTILESVDDQFPLEEKLFGHSIIEEYSKFLTSPWQKLGLDGLKLIALTNSKQIHVYQEAEESDSEGIEHEETLNSRGDTEHYVLMKEDGSFQRLDLNFQRFTFLMQSACQEKIYQKLVSELRPSKMQDLVKTYLMVKKIAHKWMELLEKAKQEKKKIPKW